MRSYPLTTTLTPSNMLQSFMRYSAPRFRPSFTKGLKVTTLVSLVLLIVRIPAQALIGVEYQMLLGNPSNAAADTNNHDHYLIQRTVQALDYSDNLGLPVWASWNLTASDIGTNTRSSYITDTTLPPNFCWVTSSDYNGCGYDRGHLCPSKDRTDTAANNDLIFYMSNIMPQCSVNNSGVWLQFENYCRDLVQSTNNYELLILCGPSGFCGSRINTNGPVFIPDYVWKMVVVVPPGPGLATNRITTTNRVIALKIPNDDSATNYWPAYVTSVNQIQVDTGFTFFTALPEDVAAALRSKVDGQTNPPPVIVTFWPTNGSAGTSITITGTNFASASAVAFNGTVAAFTVLSDSVLTTVVPTNAGCGFVSVTTPSGTAISTHPFTVLNNGGTVYTGTLAGWDVSGLTNFGVSPLPATTNATNLSVSGLTRGSGVKLSGSAASGGWGGVGFTNITAVAAVDADQVATFTITATNGYEVSFSSVTRFDYYRSATGPTNGVLQFRVGTGNFNDITNLSYATASDGASIGTIDLSGFAALQEVGANTDVTFRIVNYGGGSKGTWYLYDTLGTTAPDLALQGVVTQVLSTNAPAAAPTLALATSTSHQVILSLTGTPGTNYVVQAATDLTAPDWISLWTNSAPFDFIETNAAVFSQRYYRALLAP